MPPPMFNELSNEKLKEHIFKVMSNLTEKIESLNKIKEIDSLNGIGNIIVDTRIHCYKEILRMLETEDMKK